MLDFTEDTVNQTCVAKSEKLVTEVTISKEISPFSFFVINFKNGKVPKELSGRYTSVNAAKKALESYHGGIEAHMLSPRMLLMLLR